MNDTDNIIVYNPLGVNTIKEKNHLTPAPEKCSGYGIGNLIKNVVNPVGCEIGLAEGFTTEYFLNSNDTLILYAIDPFTNYVDWNGNILNEREFVGKEFLRRTEKFGERLIFIRKYSDDAVNDIPDNSLDFIFIDGLHTYDQLTKDMKNYYPKVKNGGIFSGHDYTAINCITDAVNDFAKFQDKQILTTECDVWYWYKD